ncbi:unnamed protein product [Ilex paraguariensis]|uniref:Uncharacterized protein n=1 Tax=Ilex paraguariensis TaxID=185542 RepID=A0ABC8S117_9AQUA
MPLDVKLRSLKLRQDSKERGAFFVAFKSKEVESAKSTKAPLKFAKAISVHALSPNKFLVLSSDGDLHLLSLANPVHGSEIPCHLMQLTCTMKVQKLTVFSDISIGAHTVWISDGHYTVHLMVISDSDTSASESDKKDTEEKLMQISVNQAIFASEKIQEVLPMAENAILILGQGSIFTYAIS